MNRIPGIDMTATGINITRMRNAAGLTVKDVQDVFGFSTPQAIYKWRSGFADRGQPRCPRRDFRCEDR